MSTERPSITVLALTLGLAGLLFAFTSALKSLITACTEAMQLARETITPTADVRQPEAREIPHNWWQDTDQATKLGDPTDWLLPDPLDTSPHATMIPAGTSPLAMMRGQHNLAGEEYGVESDV